MIERNVLLAKRENLVVPMIRARRGELFVYDCLCSIRIFLSLPFFPSFATNPLHVGLQTNCLPEWRDIKHIARLKSYLNTVTAQNIIMSGLHHAPTGTVAAVWMTDEIYACAFLQ